MNTNPKDIVFCASLFLIFALALLIPHIRAAQKKAILECEEEDWRGEEHLPYYDYPN